jgi:hypothetical protein
VNVKKTCGGTNRHSFSERTDDLSLLIEWESVHCQPRVLIYGANGATMILAASMCPLTRIRWRERLARVLAHSRRSAYWEGPPRLGPDGPALFRQRLRSHRTFEVTQELTVPLDPLSSEKPKFAKLAVPVPLTDEQKKRLQAFIETL